MRLLPFLTLSLALTLAACASTTPTSTVTPAVPLPTESPAGPLLTMVKTGGLCSYGPCYLEVQLQTTGAFTLRQGEEVVRTGQFDAGQLAALNTALPKADFAALRAIPFTEMCPTAYDGSKTTYTFYTTHGPEAIDTCEFVIDPQNALFQAADALFTAAFPVE